MPGPDREIWGGRVVRSRTVRSAPPSWPATRHPVMALLCALLLLATDDRALHLSAVAEVLFVRISDKARTGLCVKAKLDNSRLSFLARYRQVRYLCGGRIGHGPVWAQEEPAHRSS